MNKDNDCTLLIAQTLTKLFDFEWASLTMYYYDDIYYRIPQLIFRLKDKSKYSEIKTCIERFNGSIKWVLYKYKFSKNDNYVIAPFVVYEIEKNHYEKGESIDEKEILPMDQYKSICEKAIEDIPKLAEHMQKYFNI